MFEIERYDEALVGTASHRTIMATIRSWQEDQDLHRTIAMSVYIQSPRHVWLSVLHCNEPGIGLGGRMLDLLCSHCDGNGVFIELRSSLFKSARGQCESPLDQHGLNAFYARRGFASKDPRRPDKLVREPRPDMGVPNHRACIEPSDRATFTP